MFNSIWKEGSVKQGIAAFLASQTEVPTFRQNLEARVSDNLVVDGINTWSIWLDSRTAMLEGGRYDAHESFKIDHEFDLKIIAEGSVVNGAVSIDESLYQNSQGTEFVIIKQNEISGAECDYAIRRDKYDSVKDDIKSGQYGLDKFVEAGGFKINQHITTAEAESNDGWLELCVEKNKAAADDYNNARDFLGSYVDKAEANNCFPNNNGMGVFVNIGVGSYRARLWCVNYSLIRSGASGRNDPDDDGRLLRVRLSEVAEGDAPENQQVTVKPEFIQPYKQLEAGDPVVNTPHGTYVLTMAPVSLKQ